MTNFEAVERFDQAHCAKIEKLFWIAGSLESSDLKDLIGEMEDGDFKQCFPEIYKSEYYREVKDDEQLMQALIDFKKAGLIAQVLIPKAYGFRYENNKPVGWSISSGSCRIEYVYAETLEDLMKEIEKAADKVFKEYLKKDKKKTAA